MSIIIDPSNLTVTVDGMAVRLTRSEFCIFHALVKANGRSLDYGFLCELATEVIGGEVWVETVRVMKCRVNKKLARFGISIKSHHSVGYTLPKLEVVILPRAEQELNRSAA